MLTDAQIYPADIAAAPAWRLPPGDPGRGLPFSALLRMSRLRARLTQEQAAGLFGVRGNTVARWEAGEFAPPTAAELPVCQEQVLAMLSREIPSRPRRPRWQNQPPAKSCQGPTVDFCKSWEDRPLPDANRPIINHLENPLMRK